MLQRQLYSQNLNVINFASIKDERGMAANAFLHSVTGFGKSLVGSEAVRGELASSVAPHANWLHW